MEPPKFEEQPLLRLEEEEEEEPNFLPLAFFLRPALLIALGLHAALLILPFTSGGSHLKTGTVATESPSPAIATSTVTEATDTPKQETEKKTKPKLLPKPKAKQVTKPKTKLSLPPTKKKKAPRVATVQSSPSSRSNSSTKSPTSDDNSPIINRPETQSTPKTEDRVIPVLVNNTPPPPRIVAIGPINNNPTPSPTPNETPSPTPELTPSPTESPTPTAPQPTILSFLIPFRIFYPISAPSPFARFPVYKPALRGSMQFLAPEAEYRTYVYNSTHKLEKVLAFFQGELPKLGFELGTTPQVDEPEYKVYQVSVKDGGAEPQFLVILRHRGRTVWILSPTSQTREELAKGVPFVQPEPVAFDRIVQELRQEFLREPLVMTELAQANWLSSVPRYTFYGKTAKNAAFPDAKLREKLESLLSRSSFVQRGGEFDRDRGVWIYPVTTGEGFNRYIFLVPIAGGTRTAVLTSWELPVNPPVSQQ